MEPYKATVLPVDVKLEGELLNILCEANEKYGEYKGYLRNIKFDYKFFLESIFVIDCFHSLRIDEIKLNREDMFYMEYKLRDNNISMFLNLKNIFVNMVNITNNSEYSLELLNKMNKILFNGCKKDSKTKGSGKLRKKQTYILKQGLAGSVVTFVPPVYNDVNPLMKNLVEYINSLNIDPYLLKIAITHYQMQVIHPYNSGNGKLGRINIPVQLSYYKKDIPIMFMSEIFDTNRTAYFKVLNETVEKGYETFIKFFLQNLIEQCNINIKKIKQINKVYLNDSEEFKSEIGGTTINKVYPIIIKRIVFTTADIVNDTKLHINSVNKVLNKLVDKGYLVKEKKSGTNRVTFKYSNMHDIFISETK